jgi:hypothetical protein
MKCSRKNYAELRSIKYFFERGGYFDKNICYQEFYFLFNKTMTNPVIRAE